MTPSDVGSFFDRLTSDYTAVIERAFPRYRDMLRALLDYLSVHLPVAEVPEAAGEGHTSLNGILELGCGTGNLSVLLEQQYPNARLTLVDISAESLAVCRERLENSDRHQFVVADFRELSFAESSFAAVTSSIAIHHLPSPDKQGLFQRVARWLEPGGTLIFADQFRAVSETVYARHIELWKAASLEAGSNEAEFAMWMEHQRDHDHHDSLAQHAQWIEAAGLTEFDCVWRCLLWSVVMARRPLQVQP